MNFDNLFNDDNSKGNEEVAAAVSLSDLDKVEF
jgi:Fe-S-cluster formation regulator IscX/YfhJ